MAILEKRCCLCNLIATILSLLFLALLMVWSNLMVWVCGESTSGLGIAACVSDRSCSNFGMAGDDVVVDNAACASGRSCGHCGVVDDGQAVSSPGGASIRSEVVWVVVMSKLRFCVDKS